MTEQRFRVGIVGLEPGRGWAARAHVPALRALSDSYEIVGVANTSLASAQRAAAALGLPRAFNDVAELVSAPEVDIVTVTVKVPHHLEVVKAAIEAGKHVYCEWPLGNGLAEAEELAELAKAKSVLGVVGTRSGDLGAFTGFSVHQVRIVAAVGDHDVWIAVTVEVRQGHVPCAPLGIAERAEFSEVALAVIQVDEFAIGRIVADHDVQVAVAIDIGQRRRIGAVGRRPQVTGDKAAMAIVQKHAIEERPMPPFAKNDVR
jgi:hypothetical protein